MNCTWKGCDKEASKPQIAKDGTTWANLCAEHDQKIDEIIGSGDPKKILGCWIMAQGGAKKAAERI